MPPVFGPRLPYLAIFLICTALLGYGYYLQFIQGQEPCPLCMLQRACYFGIALVALIGGLHGPARIGQRIYAGLIALVALGGVGLAARQTWLQHLPEDRIPECGPSFDFMLDMYPLAETIKRSLRGSGDCAKVDWIFLGLSIAEWSLICFSGILLLALAQAVLAPGRR